MILKINSIWIASLSLAMTFYICALRHCEGVSPKQSRKELNVNHKFI